MSALPRGIRNHNPGNIRRDDGRGRGTPWQGLAGTQPDPDFWTFASSTDGIRALARTLITYQDTHGLRTVADIIARWAPPNENDTAAYARAVSRALGNTTDAPVDVHQYRYMEPMVRAIIRHENGDPTRYGRTQWYAQWEIDEALRRVAVLPAHPVAKAVASPEAIGSGVAGAAGLTAAGSALLDSSTGLRHASEGSIAMTVLVTLLVVAGVALTVYGILRRSRG